MANQPNAVEAVRLVHVAVGAIVQGDKVLLAKRADHQHQGGLWEFPGGKVETGETVAQALTRELHEELCISVTRCEALIQIRHDYGDKQVLLDVWLVTDFNGIPKGQEGQPLRWVALNTLNNYAFPAANKPIINALTLPKLMAISPSEGDKNQVFKFCENALQKGAKAIQLRSPQLTFNEIAELFERLKQNHPHCTVWINSTHLVDDIHQWDTKRCNAFKNIHLCARHLSIAKTLVEKKSLTQSKPYSDHQFIASCHNSDELKLAEQFAVAAYLSPVKTTASHPNATVLGWQAFAQITAKAIIPVYALGGLMLEDLPLAQSYGAQGIAGISCFK